MTLSDSTLNPAMCCRYASDFRSQRTGATCNKQQYRHRQLTAGLFFVYCLDCSHCVGFVAMKDAESPRTLFEAIYVHWPVPPQVVVYDNSCHAMTYALNREPEWFKNVQWVIDATHFPGHTGCADAFDIKRQPLLSTLNSQICEQRVSVFVAVPVFHSAHCQIAVVADVQNSRLTLVQKQCAFMDQLTFLPYIRYFAHGINSIRNLPWS